MNNAFPEKPFATVKEAAKISGISEYQMRQWLSQAALSNNVNFTYAIFIQKAIHQLRESVEIIARPAAPLGESADASTIAERYRKALPAAFDTDEEQ